MRVAERSWGLARGVRAKNKGRRRRGGTRAVHRKSVGGPQSRAAGSFFFFAKGEARRFSRSVVAGRDLPLPRFSEARGGVMNILLATFSAVLGPRGAVYGDLRKC